MTDNLFDDEGIKNTNLYGNYKPEDCSDPQVLERIKGRIKLQDDYTNGRITRQQFDEGCKFYDGAAGFNK